MYNDFKIAITTTENVLRIKRQYNFVEHIALTSTLSGIPFTSQFINNYPEELSDKSYPEELIPEFYTGFHFLWDYSDIPIILYEISFHHDLGGKGDEAWLFADHKLALHYFEAGASIGHVLNNVLADLKLDLGSISLEVLNGVNVPKDAPVSFTSLGFKFKKNPEDFFS
ncbi:MAG TPA: hypothetical protein VK177_04540 [Flavobacteriales bacterium]|nr:hypothetical protein [Flavobacteriales bacterium]